MNTRVFISGKIEENDNYFEEFENAEKKLSVLDYSVVNPAKILKPLSDTNGFFTHDEYMEICFTLIEHGNRFCSGGSGAGIQCRRR